MRSVALALLLVLLFPVALGVDHIAQVHKMVVHKKAIEPSRDSQERAVEMTVTYYCDQDCHPRDSKEYGVTATGAPAGMDTVASDWKVLPPGTQVYIPGVGFRVVTDSGGAIRGNHLDVWEKDHHTCIELGKKRLTVRVFDQ